MQARGGRQRCCTVFGLDLQHRAMLLGLERRVIGAVIGLTAVSLALVFGVVLGAVPGEALPRVPALLTAVPHVNAALSLAAIPTIGLGWRWIRRGEVARHRRAMLAGLVLFAAFLALYLYKVAIEGPTAFPGPAAVETYVYLPLLGIHVALAILCIPLLYTAVVVAATRPVDAIRSSPHARIGRVAAPLWIVSFALGLLVYVMLYHLY